MDTSVADVGLLCDGEIERLDRYDQRKGQAVYGESCVQTELETATKKRALGSAKNRDLYK